MNVKLCLQPSRDLRKIMITDWFSVILCMYGLTLSDILLQVIKKKKKVQSQTKSFFTPCVLHKVSPGLLQSGSADFFRAIFSLVLLIDLGFLVSLGHLELWKGIIHVSVHIYHKPTGIIFQRG